METLQAQSRDSCVESTPKAEAYSDVQYQLQATHKPQKERYKKKIHDKQYQKGDLVWLYNSATPHDQSKKLRHPWTGPFKVVERIGEADYRVKELFGKKVPAVVCFDRLKPCHPGTRFPQQTMQQQLR